MDKYLIAVDLDGTLIPGLYDLPEYTITAFNKIRECGHKIIITTGRPYRSSEFVYSKFNLDTPIINYSGQYIHNPSNKNYKDFNDFMSLESILKIYNDTKDMYSLFFCELFDNIYSNIDDENAYKLMHHNNMSKLIIGDLNTTLKSGIHGSLILSKEGFGNTIKDYINNNFKDINARIWSWGDYKEIVELYSTNVTKADSLKKVANELGFSKDHIIACGDSINDLEMFMFAGIRVSLEQADERIKEISDYITPYSCKESGIARFLLDYLKIDE